MPMIRVQTAWNDGTKTDTAIDTAGATFLPDPEDDSGTVMLRPEGGRVAIFEPFDQVWAKIQRAQSGAGDE